MHFLALEPTGSIDPNARKGEGDYGGMQMMFTMVAGGAMAGKEAASRSEFENAREQAVDAYLAWIRPQTRSPATPMPPVAKPQEE